MSQERRALWVLVCLVLSACVLLAPPADAATTSTWTGAVDNNWYSDSNWIGISPGGGGLGFFNDMAIFGPTGLATPQVNPNPMPFDMGTILYTAGAKPYTLTMSRT